MRISSAVKYSHKLLTKYVRPNDVVIDATLGNGHDSLFLAGLAKKVYSFDIQELAIKNSQKRLDGITNVALIHDSHEHYLNYVQNYQGVVFNLGYLPTSDKQITTTAIVTINTLDMMLRETKANYIILVVYPGHDEGMVEHIALKEYIKSINNYIVEVKSFSLDETKPYVITLLKKSA